MHGVNSVLIFACILIFDFFFLPFGKKKKEHFQKLASDKSVSDNACEDLSYCNV